MKADYSLYVVTDEALAAGRPLPALVAAAVDGGATIVQLRAKELGARRILRLAADLLPLLRRRGVPLIMNDRADLALLGDADGLHVGQDDIPAAAARRLLGPGRILGVSVSSVSEAVQAARGGADYLGVSPVFTTPTKADAPAATGLAGLRRIRAAVRLPLVAIGGMSASNAAAAVAAGADGVAVVSAIMTAADPAAAASAILAAVAAGRLQRDQKAGSSRPS